MQARIGLEGWIETYASYGRKNAVIKVWKSLVSREIPRLEEEGFVITYISEAEAENQAYYEFDWSNPTVEGMLAFKMLEISLAALENLAKK